MMIIHIVLIIGIAAIFVLSIYGLVTKSLDFRDVIMPLITAVLLTTVVGQSIYLKHKTYTGEVVDKYIVHHPSITYSINGKTTKEEAYDSYNIVVKTEKEVVKIKVNASEFKKVGVGEFYSYKSDYDKGE